MPLGEIILIEKDRASSSLANDQIEPADVAEIAGHDATAVAVAVSTCEIADVQEITLAIRPADVEKSPLPLESAEVMAVLDNIPRVIHPPFTEGGIELARHVNFSPAIIWL
jgi:hypothetical protein